MNKKIILLILCIALVLNFVSCVPQPTVCEHMDLNGDSSCDFCGEEMDDPAPTPEPCDHRDEDDNSKCDKCGADFEDGIEPEPCNHRDEDDNSKCDKCGTAFEDGLEPEPCNHRDEDDDSKCDKCGADFEDGLEPEPCDHRDENDDSKCDKCGAAYEDGEDIISLDGKKIMFIGNSYTFWGQTVLNKLPRYLRQDQRINDKGFFYQLCRLNGEDVSVTNWTFGSHTLGDVFGGNCRAGYEGCAGVDHSSYIIDRSYDYVVIQPTVMEDRNESTVYYIDYIMDFFREANPDVKFVILMHHAEYGTISHEVGSVDAEALNELKRYANEGVIIVDWGRLVMDIINGQVAVNGAGLTYNQNSFVIAKSHHDGYHPNMLTGYITTLMTYCAITGASPVGQPYDFCNDSSLKPSGGKTYMYSFEGFISEYYIYNNATTNFPDIFASREDMESIQELIAAYLEAKTYMNYNYSKSRSVDTSGNEINSAVIPVAQYNDGDVIEIKSRKLRESD